MYDELVAMLRKCATEAAACKTCELDSNPDCSDYLMKQAADAIEELSKRVPPVPHGRLIDADAFIARFAKAEEMLSVLPVPEEFKQIYSELAGEMKEEIQECPTIIPADKEAE